MASHIAKQAVKSSVKPVSFWNNLFTDLGNFPLIAANTAGASLIVIFGGRKLLFHPDISVSEELRFSNDVQNETATRLKDADTFRHQTRMFGTMLRPLSSPIMSVITGTPQGIYMPGEDKPYDKWSLNFLIPTEMSPPLESTDAFDDGLFEGIKASSFALNEENQKV